MKMTCDEVVGNTCAVEYGSRALVHCTSGNARARHRHPPAVAEGVELFIIELGYGLETQHDDRYANALDNRQHGSS